MICPVLSEVSEKKSISFVVVIQRECLRPKSGKSRALTNNVLELGCSKRHNFNTSERFNADSR